MEQVLFLKRDTRLAILNLMLELYNNPVADYYDRNGEFQYIEKCAKKFNILENIGEAAYIVNSQSYKILSQEKDVVKTFFRNLIYYQAFVKTNRSSYILWPLTCANCHIEKIDKKLIIEDYVKIDPLEGIMIYSIGDINNKISQASNNDIYYKDL